MPRILGVDIPNDRSTVVSLTYLYGVGPKTARDLCQATGVDPNQRARDLHEDEVARIAAYLDTNYTVEGQLRREVAQNITRLRDNSSYCGIPIKIVAKTPAPTAWTQVRPCVANFI